MKKVTTFFLKICIILIAFVVLVLSIFYLPRLADHMAEIYPDYGYLQYPVLIGLYITVIPFFLALYNAFKILNYIDHNKSFSLESVKFLRDIKYCGIIISVLYLIGEIFLIVQNANQPGVMLMGFVIIFASIVIAVFAAVLERLLKNVVEIKLENELTI